MVRAFVLIDALPGMERDVYEGVSKIRGVVGRRLLQPKAGNMDVVVLLEASDHDAVDKVIAGQLRGVSGVMTVQRLMPQHTLIGTLPKVLQEMEREAGAPKDP